MKKAQKERTTPGGVALSLVLITLGIIFSIAVVVVKMLLPGTPESNPKAYPKNH